MIITTWLCKPFDGCLIKFSDTFIKKVVRFFEPFCAHLQSKFTKSANKSKKKFRSKNAEFHADFESIEKVLKKCTKKVISKNVTKICTIFTFTHVRQTCFAFNFFCAFLTSFSTDSKSD
jgi:hypothetical protein